jgi:hypothetical protein
MDGFLVVKVRGIVSGTKCHHDHDWVSIQKIESLGQCLQELLISPARLTLGGVLLEVKEVTIILNPFQEWLIVVVIVPLKVVVSCTFIGTGGHNYFLH